MSADLRPALRALRRYQVAAVDATRNLVLIVENDGAAVWMPASTEYMRAGEVAALLAPQGETPLDLMELSQTVARDCGHKPYGDEAQVIYHALQRAAGERTTT